MIRRWAVLGIVALTAVSCTESDDVVLGPTTPTTTTTTTAPSTTAPTTERPQVTMPGHDDPPEALGTIVGASMPAMHRWFERLLAGDTPRDDCRNR